MCLIFAGSSSSPSASATVFKWYLHASKQVMTLVRSDAVAGSSQADSDAHEEAHGQLPPRIVVHMPDGEVSLGESKSRLPSEEKSPAQAAANGGAGRRQPSGTWASVVTMQYTTALKRLLHRRARQFMYPLGEHAALKQCQLVAARIG
jgi:hypothetical protein